MTAITFDAASSAKVSSSSSLSWSHTCSGSERLLVVGTNSGDLSPGDRPVSSITYNSVNLTKVRSDDSGNGRSEIWYLVNPASGVNTIQVNYAGTNVNVQAGAVSLNGVDQSSPLDAHNGATGSSSSPSVSVTTIADNAWVLDALLVDNSPTITVGSGQTQRWSQNNTNSRGRGSTEGPKTPAGSVTMSWSLSSSRSWRISAAAFAPSTVVTISPPSLILTASFPATTGILASNPGALASILSLLVPTGGITSLPPALLNLVTTLIPNILWRYVIRMRAKRRKVQLAGEQRSTDFDSSHRDTQIIVRSKRK